MSDEHHIYRERIGDAPPIERGEMLATAMLVGAPLAFMAAQMLRYSLVGPACELGGARVLLEISTVIALAGAVWIGLIGWRHMERRTDHVSQDATAQPRFLGAVALGSGALFLLAGLLLWLPSLFLSPCGRP